MKRLAIQVHLWLGLTVGLFWAVQGLTGAALVFHREIDRWSNPERIGSAQPMASLDTLAAAAKAVAGSDIKRIGRLDARTDLLVADYTAADGTDRTLILDAATGRVVDTRVAHPTRPGEGSTSRFLYNLHEELLAGETGKTIVGISGLVLLSTVGLGLWIGWPGRWRFVARIGTWRSRAQSLYGWHRLVGLGAALALIPLTLTGAYMIFQKPVRAALADVVGFEAPYKPKPLKAAPAQWTSPQAALDAAHRLFPAGVFVRLTLPTAKAPVHAIRLRQPGEVRAWSGTTVVTVDAVSGTVLDSYDALNGPLANRIADAAFPVHNGEIGGAAGRALILLAGLSLPTFYVTGVWLWFVKRRRRTSPVLSPAK